MNIALDPTAARNPLDLCIDDAVSHGGVLMAELVARARKSLYETARRVGEPPESAGAAAQARQQLGDRAGFFEDEFPSALLAAMRYPQPSAVAPHEALLVPVRDAIEPALAAFAALAAQAVGLEGTRMDANPLTVDSVVQAIQVVVGRTGVGEAVSKLWMRHLCQALGTELSEEYDRLSDQLREALASTSRSPVAVTAPTSISAPAAAVEALADLSAATRPEALSAEPAAAGAAQRIAADIATWPEMANVPDAVRNFVLGPWSEVIAQAEAAAGNPTAATPTDPDGYLALVRPLFWSAQPTLGRSDMQRLMVTVPSLLSRLRSGLQSIGYPADKAAQFFHALDDLHGIAARAAGSSFATRRERRTSSLPAEALLPVPSQATLPSEDKQPAPARSRVSPAAASQALVPGAQLAAWEGGRWVRWELTWASPKGKLLMFLTEEGETDSMSRSGCIRRIVEQRMHLIPDISF